MYPAMNSAISKVNTGSIIICVIAVFACFLPILDVFESEPLNEVLDFFDFESASFSLYTMMSIATKDEIWELLPDNIQETISTFMFYIIIIIAAFIIIIAYYIDIRISINNNHKLNTAERDYMKRKAVIWLARAAAILSLIEGVLMFFISQASKGLLSLNWGFWFIILASVFCLINSFTLNDLNNNSTLPMPVNPHNKYYHF